jgi:cell division protein FtsW (lipid II flippase)
MQNIKNYFKKVKLDSYITILTFALLLLGFAIFFSASLGVMARQEAKFYAIIQNQVIFGVLFGSIIFFIGALFPKDYIKNTSPLIYLIGIILCILVYVPGIGFEHGGARRWVEIAGFSMQPSEVLKYASILLLGALYTWQENLKANRNYPNEFSLQYIWQVVLHHRLTPVVILTSFVGIVLKNPDLGTSAIILSGIFSVFFVIRILVDSLI